MGGPLVSVFDDAIFCVFSSSFVSVVVAYSRHPTPSHEPGYRKPTLAYNGVCLDVFIRNQSFSVESCNNVRKFGWLLKELRSFISSFCIHPYRVASSSSSPLSLPYG